MEGSPSQEASRYRRSASKKHGSPDSEECIDENTKVPKDLLSQIESDFLREFEHAKEQLAKTIEPGNTEMPDAMETIFQAALAFGKHGGSWVSGCYSITPLPSFIVNKRKTKKTGLYYEV
ncbi:non-specific serine/threonine protein kinase [Trifolium repens]|nr:non-specific serine/threonine protein kinase [Trifolium repens]